MATINIDREAINKQIKNSKLKLKLVITAGLLLAAIVVWVLIRFFGPQPEMTDEEYEALAEPFSFRVDESLLNSLDEKIRFSPEDLESTTIWILDEFSAGRSDVREVKAVTGPQFGTFMTLGQNSQSLSQADMAFQNGEFDGEPIGYDEFGEPIYSEPMTNENVAGPDEPETPFISTGGL